MPTDAAVCIQTLPLYKNIMALSAFGAVAGVQAVR
ncbi:MAG: hypothetical protein UY35_C0009G0003 [Candidatus Saccharibacteria bacterium GW2011_GWC2_48_9]|nr:MAG: hypothetical protein UY35_C0009G0003 [Candidatus Saccharibacteria bacterium GW2011_GWC2_48_9]